MTPPTRLDNHPAKLEGPAAMTAVFQAFRNDFTLH